ncbi:hypothetical protein AWB76_04077 [Caballeronia temeraria]|uniref:N-acetyltransferase GCN5 n=1 Tax=Caballeronia temeraria TaxID=1777137 RepID=A0A158BDX0_9BURK|nr:hypothetical protein [Caballeronia temeraria]SAK68259.1 hypothetical protein AWB76_04077 [Caballeronia temeraria]
MIHIRPEPVTDAVRDEVAAAFDANPLQRAKTDTSAGMVDAVRCLDNAVFCRVFASGVPVAFFALRIEQKGTRREAEVTIAHGRAAFDLTAEILPMIERAAADLGAHGLTVVTRRGGLVKKLKSAGYGTAAVRLRKELAR